MRRSITGRPRLSRPHEARRQAAEDSAPVSVWTVLRELLSAAGPTERGSGAQGRVAEAMRTLTFTVVGVAQTQGSPRAFMPKGWTRPFITHDNPKTKGWGQLMANCAALELRRPEHAGRFFAGPVALEVVFYLPRPKRLLTKTMARLDVAHTTKPDADKLARACKDALSKVIWNDDAQVTDLIARKRYCAEGEHPRAVITVRETNPSSLLEASCTQQR